MKILQIKNQPNLSEASLLQLIKLKKDFRRIQRLSLYRIEQKRVENLWMQRKRLIRFGELAYSTNL
jgi:hypothetical protein